MSYTTDQLDAFWSRYVTVREVDVVSLVYQNWLYGSQTTRVCARVQTNGNNKYIGRYGGGNPTTNN